MTGYKPKAHLDELDNPDFHVCDFQGCNNSYTPFEDPGGNRYCVTHAAK